ncbi:hypothetical protein AC578_10492 [Lecanosticta acicola]|uniref:Pyridoxamine 5'-phosphate oxidase putative domain-containing protein n=1 Tax=Lecanosticta acicola TaxID=111012 RepID=A0AAI9EFM7_9PEZI|nr:hypothetical protein AC578_10492 [Lecanosticta acicola]
MGVFYEGIPSHLQTWILEQKILWVATAPLAASHHINLSPKGGPYFGLLDAHTFWYMDLSGSGSETIAHLRENGRITVLFHAFTGAPRIVRLWGYGEVLERGSVGFEKFVEERKEGGQGGLEVIAATRSIIVVSVHQVGSSCGYSVPFFEFREFRKTLNRVFEKKERDFEAGRNGGESKDRYWAYKNAWSIDGLPGMQRGLDCAMRELVQPIEKFVSIMLGLLLAERRGEQSIGPFAPPAPYGPKSWNLRKQIRYQLAVLDTTRIQLKSVLIVVLLAFALGFLVATYMPRVS